MAADGDWQDFYEFQDSARGRLDQQNRNAGARALDDEGGVGFSALACGLEEKLSLCFRPSSPDAESPRAVVRPITERSLLQEDEILKELLNEDLIKLLTAKIAEEREASEPEVEPERIWNALTDNYGNVMPVDWKSSHTRTLHLLTLNLSEKGINDNLILDTSDDEELREQLDMHSIIVSCISDEPLFTADQVIEEIEEMMQESPDPEDDETPTQSDRLSMLSQEIQTLKRSSTSSYEERVKRLSVSELNELLEEIETAIKDYSEELVQQLALRDELEFEKEVKNSFISVLIEVQNKQKEHKETAKKKKKLKNSSPQNGKNEKSHMPGTNKMLPYSEVVSHPYIKTVQDSLEDVTTEKTLRFSMEGISNVIQNGFRHTFGNSGGEKQYLTTVIPYEKKNGPPSVEDLQILTKILHAMKEDSDKVPSLLTDYILKVLCPT